METYKERILREYFKRSYFAVDGLWFMKTEEEFSFQKALELDKKVWSILPKIQARKVKELLDIKGNTTADLINALKLKWTAEDYEFEIVKNEDNHAEIRLKKCPWLEIMKKSGREHLTKDIGGHICTVEFETWAKEFNPGIEFRIEDRLCREGKPCKLTFSLRDR
jgi:hypothetical protein